jgi:hypothetical protein
LTGGLFNEPPRETVWKILGGMRWHTLLTMENRKYFTDLSDAEWDCVGPYLRGPKGRGRPKIHGSRAILEGAVFFYVL